MTETKNNDNNAVVKGLNLMNSVSLRSEEDQNWRNHDCVRVVARFRPTQAQNTAGNLLNVSDSNRENLVTFVSEQEVLMPRTPRCESETSSSPVDYSSVVPSLMKCQSSVLRPYRSTLDKIFQPNTTQREFFRYVGRPAILACVEGFNASLIAYGPVGSGKTHSMFGPSTKHVEMIDIETFGLVPRSFVFLFHSLDVAIKKHEIQTYAVDIQFLQIYKSSLLDMLQMQKKAQKKQKKKRLVIKTDFATDDTFVSGLSTTSIANARDALSLLRAAESNRIVTAVHPSHKSSSRSHMLVMMTVAQTLFDGTSKTSNLTFADLAGSEDLKNFNLPKHKKNLKLARRRQEAIAINASLSNLNQVIADLAKKGKSTGYRNNLLTHILKGRLGGNSKTTMFITASPDISNRIETIRALRLAATTKKVKMSAKKNVQISSQDMMKTILELRDEIQRLSKLNDALKKENSSLKLMNKNNLTRTLSASASASASNLFGQALADGSTSDADIIQYSRLKLKAKPQNNCARQPITDSASDSVNSECKLIVKNGSVVDELLISVDEKIMFLSPPPLCAAESLELQSAQQEEIVSKDKMIETLENQLGNCKRVMKQLKLTLDQRNKELDICDEHLQYARLQYEESQEKRQALLLELQQLKRRPVIEELRNLSLSALQELDREDSDNSNNSYFQVQRKQSNSSRASAMLNLELMHIFADHVVELQQTTADRTANTKCEEGYNCTDDDDGLVFTNYNNYNNYQYERMGHSLSPRLRLDSDSDSDAESSSSESTLELVDYARAAMSTDVSVKNENGKLKRHVSLMNTTMDIMEECEDACCWWLLLFQDKKL